MYSERNLADKLFHRTAPFDSETSLRTAIRPYVADLGIIAYRLLIKLIKLSALCMVFFGHVANETFLVVLCVVYRCRKETQHCISRR